MLASIAPKIQHGGRSEQVSWLLRCPWSCLGESPAGRRGSCEPRVLPKTSMEGAQSRSADCFAVFGRVLGHLPPAGGRVLALRGQHRRHLGQVSVLSF